MIDICNIKCYNLAHRGLYIISKNKTRVENIKEQINLWKNEKNIADATGVSPSRTVDDLVSDLKKQGLINSKEKQEIEETHQLKIGKEEAIIFPYDDDPNGDNTEDEFYSVPVLESQIAPTDLFDYEIISDASVSATTLNSLPTKEVAIKRIKPQYANGQGFNPETNDNDLTDTNYEIIYKGTKISDTLVIPYQVEIDGEMYKITKCNLMVIGIEGNSPGVRFPQVRTVIYPNTITEISGEVSCKDDLWIDQSAYENITENIILPKNLKIIGDYAFSGCERINRVVLPDSVVSIGEYVFAFSNIYCITIPSSVTRIGYNYIDTLEKINYKGTLEQWNNIDGISNAFPRKVTIEYNYEDNEEFGLYSDSVPNSGSSN